MRHSIASLRLAGLAVGLPLEGIPTTLANSELEIRRAEFGLFKQDASGKVSFAPTKRIPLVTGQSYGWRIFLKTDKPRIQRREEFELPHAPETWGEAEKGRADISAGRKVAVTEREADPAKGVIGHVWSVAQGDPAGRYVMRVFVEGRWAATFKFDAQ